MVNDKINVVGTNIAEKAIMIWNVADMLRDPFKPHEYGLVILPMIHFNPRSPCGERHFRRIEDDREKQFQSTLPVWGATELPAVTFYEQQKFQSTLPVWGATRPPPRSGQPLQISIHAPRVGSDVLWFFAASINFYFNPRSPCGERLGTAFVQQSLCRDFNPRSPCGERLICVYCAT